MPFKVPKPVLLNCWKHHAGFVLYQIRQIGKQPRQRLYNLPEELKVIGGSQMDFYIGTCSPQEIADFVMQALIQYNVYVPDSYQTWLDAEMGYRIIDLGDASRWVLRWGEQPGRFVHIHPGRYAPDTVRVRAPLLKVAIATLSWVRVYGGNPLSLYTVNKVRREILSLTPIYSISPNNGIGQLIGLLQQLDKQFVHLQ